MTEEAVSILRYHLSLPVWFPSNLIAYRMPNESWIRIIIPNNETLEFYRCRPRLTEDNTTVASQLQQSPEIRSRRTFSRLSMVKPTDAKHEVRAGLMLLFILLACSICVAADSGHINLGFCIDFSSSPCRVLLMRKKRWIPGHCGVLLFYLADRGEKLYPEPPFHCFFLAFCPNISM